MSARSFIRSAALLAAAVSLAGVLGSQTASALSITGFSGTFSGIASGERRNPADDTIIPFMEPVTGWFAVDTVIPPPYPEGCCDPPLVEPGRLSYTAPVFSFSVQAFGREIGSNIIGSGPDGVTLFEEGTAQSFTVGGGGPYWNWSMGFAAPEGGLFENFDPMTFDPTRVDMSRSFAAFSDDIRSYRAAVAFDSLVFDGYPSQVPEPTTLGLFGAGLLMLGFARRRACRSLRR